MGKRVVISSSFRPKKCAKTEHSVEDRVSQLPDDILISILSFLTVKEAATTCILSKRWKYLWTYTTRLDFDATPALERVAANSSNADLRRKESSKYVRWVKRVLKLHRSSKLDEFRVYFDLRKSYQKYVTKWIKYAYVMGVQSLELDLSENGNRYRYFRYSCTVPDPHSVCTRTLSREPYSDYCGFKSLRNLRLKSVNVSRQVLEYFLHNCPLLECLVVHGSGHLVNLEVTGPSLRLMHLEICECYKSKFIKVFDTKLVSLVIMYSGKLELRNVPMLAKLFVTGQDPRKHYYVDDVFSQFSCCCSQLEVLELELSANEIGKMQLQEFPELSKLKQLVLLTGYFEDESLIGITSLMRACPFLEKFVVKLLCSGSYTGRRRFEEATETESTLQHLKVVEWLGYYGRTGELELLTYILRNATSLEKIVIDPTKPLFTGAPPTVHKINLVQAAMCRAKDHLQLIPPHVKLVLVWDEATWHSRKQTEGDSGAEVTESNQDAQLEPNNQI